ncbi:MAG: hypothetical protein Q9227_004860 [Pyrenula ochraceoflavens]
MNSLAVLGSALCLALSASVPNPFDPSSYASSDVISRDIVIVGGGASGSYAAINARDMGKSVVVVERTGRMGGNARTYTDPSTGGHVDYGVQVYHNDEISRNFFSRLNTPVVQSSFPLAPPVIDDFSTGLLESNVTIADLGDDYLRELAKYPYVEDGFFLPDPVPQDLLLSTAAYIEKYNLTQSASAILTRPAIPGPLLDIQMLYVFNDLNHPMLDERSGNALINANNDNSQVYENAQAELGSDVLLNSVVTSAQRGNSTSAGVQLVVQTPTGAKLIQAKQLVLGFAIVPENLQPFNLDARESSVISQFSGDPYYGGVVQNTGLNYSDSYINQGATTPFHVPVLPGIINLNPAPAVEGLFYYWYSSLQPISQSQVESDVRDEIKRLQQATNATAQPEPEFVAYADYTPFHPRANSQAIMNGVYKDIYALQGYRNTWYISTLFVTGSSQVWNLTASYLPQIVQAAS